MVHEIESRRAGTAAAAQSAFVPRAATVAWQMLFAHGRVETNESVVILGARSHVGAFAIQLCRCYGVHVVAVASRASERSLLNLGAQRVVDPASARLEAACRTAAIVLETSGGDPVGRVLPALHSGSLLISCVARTSPPAGVAARGGRGRVQVHLPVLEHLTKLIDQGHLALPPTDWA